MYYPDNEFCAGCVCQQCPEYMRSSCLYSICSPECTCVNTVCLQEMNDLNCDEDE